MGEGVFSEERPPRGERLLRGTHDRNTFTGCGFHAPARPDGIDSGVVFERAHLGGNAVGLATVVRIHAGDEFVGGVLEAVVERGGETPRLDGFEPHATVGRLERFGSEAGGLVGTVQNDQEFELSVGLVEDAGGRRGKALRIGGDREDNGNRSHIEVIGWMGVGALVGSLDGG